jgi:lipopolysaccharide transport system ATP-binding protein
MSFALKVSGLGKSYLIRETGPVRARLLRDEIMEWFRNFPHVRRTFSEFWALKDVNFEIKEGEKVGVIGHNGAGKSTLLKLLSRVTDPTCGQIYLRGRVSSLLEVGTGFHPELTGRENIFLNGIILGMTRHEVRRNFDEIVDFAGIEQFLDTQVKHYSSGMYMRLAFSIAAHLDPEVLIVDEVLAVGDAKFQQKCLGKMKDISAGGRTVIFVSHSMPTVTSLCDRCILLENGVIRNDGNPSDVILDYLGGEEQVHGYRDFSVAGQAIGDTNASLLYGSVLNLIGEPTVEVDIQETFTIRMGFRVLSQLSTPVIPNFHFFLPGGICAFVSSPDSVAVLNVGDYEASCQIPGGLLNEGTYFVGLALSSFNLSAVVHFFESSALRFNVRELIELSVNRHGYGNVVPGVVRPRLPWSIREAK